MSAQLNRELLFRNLLSLPDHLQRGVIPLLKSSAPHALKEVNSAIEFDLATLDDGAVQTLDDYVARTRRSLQVKETGSNDQGADSPSYSWDKNDEDSNDKVVLQSAAESKSSTTSGSFSIVIRVITGKRIDMDGKFECSFCGRKCRSKSDLDAHIRTHTGEKPLVCPYCHKKFAHSSNLHQHKRSHKKEKRYACRFEGCGKAFAHPTSRNDHELFSHMGVRAYACDYPGCKKTFTAAANLTRHKKRIHGIQPEGKTKKNPKRSSAPAPASDNAARGRPPRDNNGTGHHRRQKRKTPSPGFLSSGSNTPEVQEDSRAQEVSPAAFEVHRNAAPQPPPRLRIPSATTESAKRRRIPMPETEPSLFREPSFPPSYTRADSIGMPSMPAFSPSLQHASSLETLVDASVSRLEEQSSTPKQLGEGEYQAAGEFPPGSLPSPQLARTWSTGSNSYFADFSMGMPSAPVLTSQNSANPVTPDSFPKPLTLTKTLSNMSTSDFLLFEDEN